MKYIRRWCLMRANYDENLFEHAFQVAVIAHALALIKNKKFGGNVDADFVATAALFHDSSEVITGDMPTPVKYYNDDIKNVYKNIECIAGKRLLDMLPEEFRSDYESFFEKKDEDKELWKLVKAADKISALIKCIEEYRMGNREFEKALEAQQKKIEEINLDEVKYFREHFLDSYYLTCLLYTSRSPRD